MDAKQLLDLFLQSGREMAQQGRELAERKLDLPKQPAEREAALKKLGAGAAAGGLLALLLGTERGREATGTALKLGTLAALGGMAYQTWRKLRAGEGGEAGMPVDQLTGPEAERRSQALLRAMIAAAKADGHIDDQEMARIREKMSQLPLGADLERFLTEEMGRPLDAAQVAAGADSPTAAAEIYLVSRIAIHPDQPAERAYLDELAQHLKLDAAMVAELESGAG